MPGPLHGRRILDLSERSAAALLAGMMLADLGAEVIRVEPTGGDPIRALDAHKVWLRGNRSVTVDQAAIDSGAWAGLLASADAVIDTAQPWTDKPAGLLDGWREDSGQILHILTAEPQSPFDALHRPRCEQAPAYSEWTEAEFDLMALQPGYRPGPTFLGWPMAAHGAAGLICISVLAGLFRQATTGQGAVSTSSLVEGAASMSLSLWWGDQEPTLPAKAVAPAAPGLALFECSDRRYIFVFLLTHIVFQKMTAVMGVDVALDPKSSIVELSLDPERYLPVRDTLQAAVANQTSDHWCEALNAADVPCVIAYSPGGILEVEQPTLNGLVDVRPDGARRFGRLAKFARTPMQIGFDIPAPGQDNDLLRAPPPAKRRFAAKLADRGPLDGLTVLDLGAYIAGPYASRLYADLGARVIKIEELTGEKMRQVGGAFDPFHPSNRGKQSIALDLKSEEGRAIIQALAARADIVYHNMREQAVVKLGVDHPTLSALNPRLIYCHSTGFGNEGPWARNPSFEYCQSAFAGMLHRTGGKGNVPAQYIGNMDWGQGLLGAVAVLAAVDERLRSGRGQYIEVPHTAAAMLAMSDVRLEGGRASETYPLDADQRGHAATNALYPAADGWLLIACYSEREWRGVAQALQVELEPYVSARARPLDGGPSQAAIEAALAGLSLLEAQRRLAAAGVVCATPTGVNTLRLPASAELRRLGVTSVERVAAGLTYWELGALQRFSGVAWRQDRAGPALGDHTVALLQEIGMGDGEICDLIARKIVAAEGR